MKSILNIFCLACVLGLIGCSQDLIQTVDKERGRDLTSSTIKLDTTYLNLNIEEVELNNEDTQKAIAELSQTNAPTTRAIKLDDKGKIKGEQKFTAICFIRNTETNQLGRFELDWTIKKNGTKITLAGEQIRKDVVITWKQGTAPTKISGDKWQVCGIAGGGKIANINGHEVISFAPDMQNVSSEGELAIPFISDYRKVRTDVKKPISINFGFKMVGTLLKLKVKRDNNVTQDEVFFFRTTGINPIGAFSLQNLTTNTLAEKAEWHSTAPIPTDDNKDADKYSIRTNSINALKVSEKGSNYFIWYVWGMPNKDRSVVETTMGSLDGGYIIKQDGKQGPLWSKHHFKNDEGKVKTFNLSIHKPEPYPSFNFLNILERVAEHNLEAPKKWWESDKVKGVKPKNKWIKNGVYICDESVFFDYYTAVNPDFMPEGYHLPSLNEMTILFPYQESTGDKDFEWKKDFTKKDAPWIEKVPLYAYQGTYTSEGKKMWGVFDNKYSKKFIPKNETTILNSYNDRNVKEFKSYIYNPNNTDVFYSIRFEDNYTYRNKIRCAYKWDFSKAKPQTISEGYVEITSRWIGDSPVTIDEITNNAWWQHNSQYNVVRRLPSQGESNSNNISSVPVAGTYLCSNKYDWEQNGGNIFARQFNTMYNNGSLQRKNYNSNRGLVRPFKNAMMCNEKSSYEGDKEKLLEEDTGKGTGQVLK